MNLPVFAFEHVEDAVLGGMHHHVRLLAVDDEVRGRDLRRAVEVEALCRRLLVVPDVLAGLGFDGDDRSSEQIVTAAGRAVLGRPGSAVARADIYIIGDRIVGDAIPGRAAAAGLPPVAAPGLRRHGKLGLLEALRRITGHAPPAPQLLARVSAVGRQVAALLELRTGLADEDATVGDARRAGDRQPFGRIGGLDFPDLLAGPGVHGEQPAVQRAPDDLALPDRDTAVDDAAAQLHRVFAGHVRVVLPQPLAGLRIEGVDLAPRRGHENAAIGDHRRRLVAAAALGKIPKPGQAQLADVVGVDLLERAVALLAVVAAVGRPLARILRQVGRVGPTSGQRRNRNTQGHHQHGGQDGNHRATHLQNPPARSARLRAVVYRGCHHGHRNSSVDGAGRYDAPAGYYIEKANLDAPHAPPSAATLDKTLKAMTGVVGAAAVFAIGRRSRRLQRPFPH